MERKSLINIMPIFFYGLYESQFNAVPSARATPRDFTCDLHNPIRARLAGLGILILLEKLRCKLRGMFQYSNDGDPPTLEWFKGDGRHPWRLMRLRNCNHVVFQVKPGSENKFFHECPE
jgi:hypothetical protein